MSTSEFLAAYPLPWRIDKNRDDVYVAICDANGNTVDHGLWARFAEFVVERVNSGTNAVDADAIARKDAMPTEATGKIDELRKERDSIAEDYVELIRNCDGMREDATSLHGLFETQSELIEKLQKRIAVLEARQ